MAAASALGEIVHEPRSRRRTSTRHAAPADRAPRTTSCTLFMTASTFATTRSPRSVRRADRVLVPPELAHRTTSRSRSTCFVNIFSFQEWAHRAGPSGGTMPQRAPALARHARRLPPGGSSTVASSGSSPRARAELGRTRHRAANTGSGTARRGSPIPASRCSMSPSGQLRRDVELALAQGLARRHATGEICDEPVTDRPADQLT